LNESSSDSDSDNEQVQAETKEAQEAGLIDLYNTALKFMIENKKTAARTNFVKITESPLFQSGEGSEQIQKTLRYNVHKNLGECFMEENNFKDAEDQFFLATQIDRTDVTLWWQLASASVKLGNFFNVRGALEEGLACSPNHWPCLENLIVVNFKLCDNFACLCYCAKALERDPNNKKAIEYKSKVYLEMPFMQEYMNDTDFVPIPVEREIYDCPPPKPEPRPRLFAEIETLTLPGLGKLLLKLYDEARGENILNCVDSEKILEDFHERARLREESKIVVSVQNLVEEMIDVVETSESERLEDVTDLCDRVLDEIVCDIFGVPPLSDDERCVRQVLNEIINESVDKACSGRKKSVILPGKQKKKHFSIFDEIPEELLEKRRSCRQTASSSAVVTSSNDNSCDTSAAGTSSAHRQLLTSFLPASIKSFNAELPEPVKHIKKDIVSSEAKEVSKYLFSEKSCLTEKEEEEVVSQFLTNKENLGNPVDQMRFYLNIIYDLETLKDKLLQSELIRMIGDVYKSWRRHWGYQLEYDNPKEPLTQQCIRYYIIGNECLVADLLEKDEPLCENVKNQMWNDLLELDTLYFELPLNTQVRVRSLRFHFFMLTQNEEELGWEIKTIEEFYEIWEGESFPVLDHHPIQKYPIVSKEYLINYKYNLMKTRELEELQEYYNAEKFQEIVDLLSETLERDTKSMMTPNKDCSKTLDRESQIDIYIESLYHCGLFEKCLSWLEAAFHAEYLKITERVENAKNTPEEILEETNTETNKESESTSKTKESKENSKIILKTEWDVLDSYLSLMQSCLDGLTNAGKVTEASTFGGQLSLSSATRLSHNLLSIILLQINDPTNPEICYPSSLPWILLHKLMMWQEKEQELEQSPVKDPKIVDLEPELPGSLSLLITSHVYLGQKSCCTMDHGKLLNYLVDIFVPVCTSSIHSLYKLPVYSLEQIKQALDQALFCLYSHPSKKSSRARHLVDHNISQVGLTWERALVLYNYVRPAKLPEHDDVKTFSITADTDSLLRRIVALIPDTIGIEKRKQISIDFITGKTSKMKKLKKLKSLPDDIKDLFYLLADYAFKSNSDMENAISYYAIDLTFNRERFDSWAALALAHGSKLDSKLNSCHLLQPPKILIEIESVEMCYSECLRINEKNSNLWIEFGNFCYSIHSYITRTLNNNAEDLNFEVFEKLEKKKEQFLKMSLKNYGKTLDIFKKDGLNENDVDERWLLLFMIGKIKEKQGQPLLTCLEFYQKSIGYLKKNGIVVPRKINYNNPQEFSIEALEVYYRIHASLLKHIAKVEREKKEIPEDLRKKYYDIIKQTQLECMYATNSNKPKIERFSNKRKIARSEELANSKMTRADETSTTIMRDVVEVMDSMIDEIEFLNDSSKYSMESLAKLCLLALEDVVFHFFHHFKALYRMAFYLHHTPTKLGDANKVKQLLLAGLTDKSAPCPGLFGGRKINMIFNEVWRIPVNEIDRPGSFAAHCAKSLILLLDVLKNIPDVALLVDISAQLRKAPNEENKFLQESDRQEIVTMAATYLNTALKNIRDKIDVEKERKKPTETLEVFKLYQKMSKAWPGKEKDIFAHLKEMYAAIKNRTEDKDKITEAEVVRFCNSETTRLRALANPKTLVSTVASTINPTLTTKTTSQAGDGGSKEKVTAAQGGASGSTMAMLHQWGQILADQQRMVQINALLAMSSALPNMTPKDIAAFCGLQETDLANLAAYTSTIASLTPANLASFGITSSHLSQLAQISSITGGNQSQMAAQATKQAQFEQDVFRSYMGGAASAALTSMSKTSSTTSSSSLSKGISGSQSKSTASASGQSKGLSVKQTTQFKAKAQQGPSAAITKKNVSKVVNLTGTKTAPSPKQPQQASKNIGAAAKPSPSMTNQALSNVAAKLSNSGVTLSKPVSRNSPSPVIRAQPANTSPVVRPQTSQTSVAKTSKDNSQNMSKKFPYLNISQVPETSGSKSKPLLSVKPSSQLLKPGAMTNLSTGAATKSSNQNNKSSPATGAAKQTAAVNVNKNTSKMSNIDARNKLALFKAQMKKQLNIPQGGSGLKSKSSTTSSPSSRASSGTSSARPSPSVSRPSSSSNMVKLTAGSAVLKTAVGSKKQDTSKTQPQAKSSEQEVICIDID